MKLLNKIMTMLCMLAMLELAVPAKVQASCGSGFYGNDCCQLITTLLFAGAIGAAAGYAASDSNGKRGHKGDTGDTGATGPQGPAGPAGATSSSSSSSSSSSGGNCGSCNDCCLTPEEQAAQDLLPFVADIGETLTFDVNLLLDGEATGAGTTIIPFVSTPDGLVVEGIAYQNAVITEQTRTIIITDPVYGTYHVGIQAFNDDAISFNIDFADADVTASSDGSVTVAPITDFAVIGLSQQVQLSGEFTYGEGNVP